MAWDSVLLRLIFCSYFLMCRASLSEVRVEEGKQAILECPGFVPDEEGDGDAYAVFNWYKANRTVEPTEAYKVAFISKYNDKLNTEHDLENRATIDTTTGALEIPQTKVTDDHLYKCLFQHTGMGQHQNETLLIITVTPSAKDLKVSTNSSGPAKEGDTIKFHCTVARVKPPPPQMYWQFTNGTEQLGDKKTTRNADNLTSSVTVEYSVRAERSQNGRTLACHYVMSDGSILNSSISTVQVLYKPSGKPSLSAESLMAKVNSRIALTCDSSTVDGVATWYEWQYNGNQQHNTSERTWFYDKWELEDKRTKLVFWCIAGNSLGQSNTSEPVEIAVDLGGPNIVLIVGCAIGGVLALGIIIGFIVFFIRRQKLKDDKLEPEIQVNVNYNVVPGGGEQIYAQPIKKPRGQKKPASNGEYANGNLGDGKTLSEDGLIYTTPDFGARPPPTSGGPPMKPPKPAVKPRHTDHTPTEYGEVDFNRMADMKKK